MEKGQETGARVGEGTAILSPGKEKQHCIQISSLAKESRLFFLKTELQFGVGEHCTKVLWGLRRTFLAVIVVSQQNVVSFLSQGILVQGARQAILCQR